MISSEYIDDLQGGREMSMIKSMDPDLYIEALTAYTELVRQARDCKELFERSGASTPEPLLALLGKTGGRSSLAERKKRNQYPHLNLPPRPRLSDMPKEAKVEWISLPAESATVSTIALALLRTNGPQTQSDLLDAIRKHQSVVPNSLYNAISRMVAESKIHDDALLLSVKNPAECPLLHKDFIWGHPDSLAPNDIARYRREVEMEMLMRNPGIMQMPMVRALEKLAWFPDKFGKDTLKTDLTALQVERKVKRSADGKGWIVNEEKEVPKLF